MPISGSCRSAKAWHGEYTIARETPGYTGVRQVAGAVDSPRPQEVSFIGQGAEYRRFSRHGCAMAGVAG